MLDESTSSRRPVGKYTNTVSVTVVTFLSPHRAHKRRPASQTERMAQRAVRGRQFEAMSAHVNGSSVQSGRPRDPRIDAEVLAATRDMLVEVGWDQLSLRAIATRAGVSRAALSRRWPSKAHLVLDSILGSTPDLAPFEAPTAPAGSTGWSPAVRRSLAPRRPGRRAGTAGGPAGSRRPPKSVVAGVQWTGGRALRGARGAG